MNKSNQIKQVADFHLQITNLLLVLAYQVLQMLNFLGLTLELKIPLMLDSHRPFQYLIIPQQALQLLSQGLCLRLLQSHANYHLMFVKPNEIFCNIT